MIERRRFLAGMAALIAAPSIVRASSLMPVRGIVQPIFEPEAIRVGDVFFAEYMAALQAEIARAMAIPYDLLAFRELDGIARRFR